VIPLTEEDEREGTMRGSDRIGDHADARYLRLSGEETAGAAALTRSGVEFGVLTDTEGHPRLLLTPDGRKASAVVIDADDPMGRVLAPDIIAILNAGVPGLVITRGARVTGVLSAAAVSDYLVEHSPVRSAGLGDEALHGNAPVKLLTLTCTTCGTVNSVVVFAEGETQCSKGHPLTIWD
jgi:hypothetical protein